MHGDFPSGKAGQNLVETRHSSPRRLSQDGRCGHQAATKLSVQVEVEGYGRRKGRLAGNRRTVGDQGLPELWDSNSLRGHGLSALRL
jgi:hypothetical protein